jgi:hypothetical protein
MLMSHQSHNLSLEQLQRWLQSVITHPGGAEGGKDSASPFSIPLQDIIPPTSKQSSTEQLGVYAAAYYLRLVDCLREFFPSLRFAMGDEIFDDFALAYLQKHPSQSYTLHRLADQFASFLAETKSTAGWEDFFVDLARLEHAMEIVFDAEGPEESIAITPEKESSTLSLVPGFQLLSFRYPVSSFYTAWKHSEQPPLPDPQAQFIALFRRDYIVRRHELTVLQHALLAAFQAGESLEQALARIAPQALAGGQTADALAAELREWFEHWTRAGFFQQTPTTAILDPRLES